MTSAPTLEAALEVALERASRQLCVDLSELSVLAAAGITVLLRARAQCAVLGVTFEVVDPSPTTSRLVSGR